MDTNIIQMHIPAKRDPLFPDGTPLAMAYVPWQKLGELYAPDEALKKGTLFPELDLPFEARGGNV